MTQYYVYLVFALGNTKNSLRKTFGLIHSNYQINLNFYETIFFFFYCNFFTT